VNEEYVPVDLFEIHYLKNGYLSENDIHFARKDAEKQRQRVSQHHSRLYRRPMNHDNPASNQIPPANGRVAIFIPTFGDGGVERMLVNIARGISGLGVPVDFIINRANVPYLQSLPAGVDLIELDTDVQRERYIKFVRYLERVRPSVVMSAKTRDDMIALEAKRATRCGTRFFLRPGTTLSERLRARGANPVKRFITYRRLRKLFLQADGIIAVSEGVADDISRITALPRTKIHVIRNPNITPEMYELADQTPDHPWAQKGAPPLIVGMGGLRRQKDFSSLIRAFSIVRKQRSCRLLILGQGRQRGKLLQLARSLGVREVVDLPGFSHNPYAILARSALFVLSSLWEGSPNVLTEALALGVPVVSTDCPSGPKEITQNGKYGPLVPVGDVEAMASAMIEMLDHPPEPAFLKAATADYTLEKSTRHYLRVFGIQPAT
jgi:glycosyltransferase involved in cell wall biosynthesis